LARLLALLLVPLMLLVSTSAVAHASTHPFHAPEWSCDDLDNGRQPVTATVTLPWIPPPPAARPRPTVTYSGVALLDSPFVPYLWRAPPAP
jgi:hypothetical protein